MTPIPSRLGPYEIIALLGSGGMGEVYRARDPRFRRDVAVKVLPGDFATDPERLKRFEHEARAVGALNHPNILTVHDLGIEGGTPYLVTELLEGSTLRERLSRGALSLAKLFEWASQIAHGLAAAHEHGIVHRDLKPENVFVTQDGRVKILDFGLARLGVGHDGPVGTTLTMTEVGVTLGTAGYMAPEQVRGKPVDARADLFSFGCLLYEMLAGKRAFPGETSVEVMSAILSQEPQPLAVLRPETPAPLERLVRHCLEKDPTLRFQSARDLATYLEDIASLAGAAAPIAPSGRTRLPWRWAIPLVTLVLGALATGLWLGRWPSRADPPSYHRLTFRRGYVGTARFSPDGQTIVYSAGWAGRPFELFSSRPESPDTRSYEFGYCDLLAISSKGEMALLLRPPYPFIEGTGTLARASLSGGAARELLDGVTAADWAPDGSQLAIVRNRNQLEFPIGKILHRSPGIGTIRFSPDGRSIAFENHPNASDYLGSVNTVNLQGQARMLSRTWSHLQGLAWVPNGREIWFSASEVGAGPALHAVDLRGHERLVVRVPGGVVIQDIAADRRVLLKHEDVRAEIRVRAPGASIERDLTWLDWGSGTKLSDDGRMLLFFETGEGAGATWKVFTRRTDGSPAVKLGDGVALALSPDGKAALCHTQSSPTMLVVLPTGAGEPDTLKGLTYEGIGAGQWFADGRRIAFTATEPGRRGRVYVQDTRGGSPRAISPEGLGQAMVAPHLDWVAAVDSTGRVVLFPIKPGPPRPTAIVLEPGEAMIRLAQDAQAVYVNRWMEPDGSPALPARVYQVDFATGTRRFVMNLAPTDPAGVGPVALPSLTPDHRGYAFYYDRVLSELFLVNGLR